MPGQEDKDRIHIPQLVHTASFLVYGLVDKPLELTVCSASKGSMNGQLTSIGFTFSSPLYPGERDNYEISSSDAKQQGVVYDLKDPTKGPLFDFDSTLFQQYHLSNEERAQAGKPYVWEGEFTVADSVFFSKIRYWSHPHQLSLFLLQGEETVLSGRAYGPSYQELLQLLKGLQTINHRDGLLMQYQYELDQETERLLRKQE